MTSRHVAGAVALLGRRSGAAERTGPRRDGPDLDRARPTRPAPTTAPSPAIERYVAECEAFLWSPAGRAQRSWLAERGFGDEVLVANRVGADPGPRRMARPAGLPRGGMGVVLPVLNEHGQATYFQTRYLGHPRRRYEGPATALVGVSPRVAEVRVSGHAADSGAVVVCEGVFDALSAAQAGQRAVAVLGVAAPNQAMAEQLVQRFDTEQLVVAFDGDPAGRAGAERMVELLRSAGAGERVVVLDVAGDLNDWLRASGGRFSAELAAEVAVAGGITPAARSTPAIEDGVETIWYRHVLVDDAVVAQANAERIATALHGFRDGRPPPTTTVATAALDADLGDLAYRFALGDDRAAVAADLDHAERAVRSWTADLHQEPAAAVSQEIPAMALAQAAAAGMEPAGLSLGVGQ